MDELYSLFNELSPSQRKLVLGTPTLLTAFCAEASEKIGVDIEVLKLHLNKLDAYTKGEADRVIRLEKSVKVIKDKGMRLIEMQGERDKWYADMVAAPLIKALAIRDMMDDGNTYEDSMLNIESEGNSHYMEKAQRRIERTNDLTPLIRKPTLLSWDDGTGQKNREKKAILYHEILSHLKDTTNGISKTELLRGIGKDNSSWRVVCNVVLEYMISRGILIMSERKYYYAAKYNNREHGYHRKIYELIVDSPQSKTSILNEMGYNNTKGRQKLSNALEQLSIEGMIIRQGGTWVIP
tara:strand:- start:589 stop:1473 length:885 start_codon:yes stop_codon:yes gene_type:complete